MSCLQLLIVIMLCKIAIEQETEILANTMDVLFERDKITLTCRPKMNGTGFSKIYGIQLKKNISSTSSMIIASVTIGESDVNWYDQSLHERAAASYNLQSVQNAMLQLDIDAQNVHCSDTSHYTCEITGQFQDSSNGIRTAGLNLKVIVYPDKIDTITVCPSSGIEGSKVQFDVGSTVKLTCRSTVGNPPRNILWCMKRSFDQSYLPIPISDSRVIQEQPILIGCQHERKGILMYNVTHDDDDTRFVCTPSLTGRSSDCSLGPVRSMFYLNKKSTDSVHSVCNALVSEGKVARAMGMEGITVHPATKSLYTAGSQIRLTCTGNTSGSVESLQIHWCIKRIYDNDFYLYPFDWHVKDDVMKSVGICMYKMNSTLFYNITIADTETEIMCQIGVTGMQSVCGHGKLNRKIVFKSNKQRVATTSLGSTTSSSTIQKTTLMYIPIPITTTMTAKTQTLVNESATERGLRMIMLLLCIIQSYM